MRATALLGRTVHDSAGARVGRVHDLLFTRCEDGDGSPVLRLTGLVCGRLGFGHRLGYGTSLDRTAGPWVMHALHRIVSRHSVIVAWDDVARLHPHRIDLGCRHDALDALSERNGR